MSKNLKILLVVGFILIVGVKFGSRFFVDGDVQEYQAGSGAVDEFGIREGEPEEYYRSLQMHMQMTIESMESVGQEPDPAMVKMLDRIETKYLKLKPEERTSQAKKDSGIKKDGSKSNIQVKKAKNNQDTPENMRSTEKKSDPSAKESSAESKGGAVDSTEEESFTSSAPIVEDTTVAFNKNKDPQWGNSWALDLGGAQPVKEIVTELWFQGELKEKNTLFSADSLNEKSNAKIYLHLSALQNIDNPTRTNLNYAISKDDRATSLMKKGTIYVNNMEEPRSKSYEGSDVKENGNIFILNSGIYVDTQQIIKVVR